MIIRLSGRGQYEITGNDSLLVELNELDNEITALLARTESEMRALLAQMTERVAQHGRVVDDDVEPSDLILPPVDLTLAEAVALFTGEGLIPG